MKLLIVGLPIRRVGKLSNDKALAEYLSSLPPEKFLTRCVVCNENPPMPLCAVCENQACQEIFRSWEASGAIGRFVRR